MTFKEIELGSGTEYADRWAYTAVHHSAEHNCWYVTAYDGNDNQVGNSDTEYRKVDAIDMARAYLHSDRCEAIFIYTKNGELQSSVMGEQVTGGSPFGGETHEL
jgi:hypothetical protein